MPVFYFSVKFNCVYIVGNFCEMIEINVFQNRTAILFLFWCDYMCFLVSLMCVNLNC